MKHLNILFLLLFAITTGYAQRFTTFSGNLSETGPEMRALFSTAPSERKKESEELMVQFDAYWNSLDLSDEIKKNFIENANQMLAKKLRPYPHFKSYIEAYIAFSGSPVSDFYREWKEIVGYHVENDATSFHNKMLVYTHFFQENYLANTTNTRWKVIGKLRKMGVREEPYMEFQDVNLIGFSKQDSLIVVSTSGTFYPSQNNWKGAGGFIFWDRAGLENKVKAQLSDYQVDMRFPKIKGENALLYYLQLFPEPIRGVVEDKAGLEVSEEKASYPRFKSYDNYLPIPNIYKEVDYIGGFEIKGASIMGSSDGDHLARVIIKKDGQAAVSAFSLSFLFKKESIQAQDAKIAIYIEEDSIYHPAASFYYSEKGRDLLISRPKNGVGRSPFINTYHKLDITVESISWKIDDERIEFKPIPGNSGETTAIFESQNYFDKSVMRNIQGYNEISPLYTLWELFRMHHFGKVSFSSVVSHFKKTPPDMKQLLMDFAAQGFIEYDVHKDEITYRSKIAQYLNNDVGKKDFDYIRLESKNHYASLDRLTNELRISGCEFFVLSDPHIVNVYPSGEKVTVKKNRDMTFSGRIVAGLFDFITYNCKFDYDRFVVDMDVIDSLIMYVEDKNTPVNMYGEYRLRRIENYIEELSGTLFIDKPGNKSGKEDYPEYPIFESRKGGKVFYDSYANNRGVYTRDRFYFYVDKFRIINLDNFEPDSMRFNGHLVSGGIFPDIQEELVARPDFSLGFVHRTGPAGLPLYQGRGHYTDMIDLSNRGLRGKGDIRYITSLTRSDSIYFFMDSLNAKANTHTVEAQQAGVEYPRAEVKNAYLHWEPYQDQMFVHTRRTPMQIFNEVELTGFSKLTPSGMYGRGVSNFKRADLTSRLFWFKHHEMLADTANLRIYALDGSDFALTTDNYNSHIDFDTRKGTFIANGEASEVLFIKNEFKAKASRFEWDPIDENVLRFRWDEDPYKDIDIESTPSRELVDMISYGNELSSTHPEKGKLQFNAVTAEFDFSKNIIKAGGVRFINVEDAALIPYNGEVTIYQNADIASFTQSRILAGRENKYHEIYNASAKVITATRLRGSGYYDYIDENETAQTIYFDTIWTQKTTQGHAKIPEELDFKFSPHFGFSGRAELHSNQEFLYYVGGVTFVNDCDSVKPAPLRILQHIDPKNILIEIHNRSKDITDRKAVVAIASTNREGRIYTCFGAAKDQFNDSEYISVFGYITYDKEEHCFKAASLEKLQDPAYPGNMITLDDYNCIGTGRGSINMGPKFGRVDFTTNGSVVNYMRFDSANMHLITSIDFLFNAKSMKIMSHALEANQSYEFVSTQDDIDYELALLDIMGEDNYNKYKKESALSGRVSKLPKELQVKFFFSNVDFLWDKDKKAFISQRTLPLIICGGTQIYKMVPGRIVIERRGSRDRLYIYLEEGTDFYFFYFDNGSMYAYSSVKEFNEEIANTKSKDRQLKSDKENPYFIYKQGTRSQHRNFVKKFYPDLEEEENE